MSSVHDAPPESEGRAFSWLVRGLYTSLIVAELYLLFDWWKDTPEGEALVERCRARLAALKSKAENCEGCARRRAKLYNRLHWETLADAEEIVQTAEGADTE